MRISNVVMRIVIAAACECCNRVTQNSSFWVVHQLVSFPHMKTEAASASTGRYFLTIRQRTRSLQNRVFRKKLQSIMVI